MWPKAISMIANGDLPLEEIITDTFPLVQFKKGIDKVIMIIGQLMNSSEGII